jgi:hypothetical protein
MQEFLKNLSSNLSRKHFIDLFHQVTNSAKHFNNFYFNAFHFKTFNYRKSERDLTYSKRLDLNYLIHLIPLFLTFMRKTDLIRNLIADSACS